MVLLDASVTQCFKVSPIVGATGRVFNLGKHPLCEVHSACRWRWSAPLLRPLPHYNQICDCYYVPAPPAQLAGKTPGPQAVQITAYDEAIATAPRV